MEIRRASESVSEDHQHVDTADHLELDDVQSSVLDAAKACLAQESSDKSGGVTQVVQNLITLLQVNTRLKSIVLPLLMALSMSGCMFSPDFDGFQQADEEVSMTEQFHRKQRINTLLNAKNLSKSSSAVISTGINPCQRERILDNFEEMIEDISAEDFNTYLSLCEKAKNLCGIMNPDRYSPRLLKEVVQNYESRERHAGRQQVLVFTSRKDIKKTFGIQALSVESYRVEELVPFYKVILIETGASSEIEYHLDKLQTSGVLEDQMLRSALVIGHGDQEDVENGISVQNMSMLSRLNRHWIPGKGASIVFFSCLSAKGKDQEMNLVNRASIIFNKKTFGCPTVVEDVEYELDSRGRLVENSLDMSEIFTIRNDTFVPNRERAVTLTAESIMKEIHEETTCRAGLDFYRDIVELGITDIKAFQAICSRKIDAKSYIKLFSAGWKDYELSQFSKADIPLEQALAYADAGVRGKSGMIKLYKHHIYPSDVKRLKAITRLQLLDDNVTHPDALIAFKRQKVSPRELAPYLMKKETGFLTIASGVALERQHLEKLRMQPMHVASR